jgi:hypothetical protein
MCLVALEDPGLTVFPTHRLVSGLTPSARGAAPRRSSATFDVPRGRWTALRRSPPAANDPLELGYIDAHHKRPLRLTLKLRDQSIADAAWPLRALPPARHRGARGAAAEGRARHDDEDISHMHGFGTPATRAGARARRLAASTTPRSCCVRRRSSRFAVAAAGVNMPPKSTYFFPKVPTGLVIQSPGLAMV